MAGALTRQGKEHIRARALDLGFGACGFTSAAPLGCGSVLAGWLAARRNGAMQYLEGDSRRRLEPRMALAGAETAIVVAWPYRPPPRPSLDWRRELTGRVAAYALGLDYHDRLADRLRELAAHLGELGATATKVHVDAGPLVEKELARRAGLGWYGRNTNLLSAPLGSYFLLACLLTDLRIEPDPAFTASHCGSCVDCLSACPTGALSSGPTIDAPRCISYLTIEHRGPIDLGLRPLVGNWVFGCDLCQEICPWNEPATEPVAELAPYLPDLLTLSQEEFSARYATSAVHRTKRRGLARNAAVALGNSGNRDAVEPLAGALRCHDEALVRSHAAWALGRLGGPAAARGLASAVRREQVPPVRREIDLALANDKAKEHPC